MSGLKEVAVGQTYGKEDVSLAALQIVIDGVACSEASRVMQQAGVYISGLIMADMNGNLDAEKQKAILSIIEMASDIENPAFRK
ncbi:hypothetical protein VINE108274_02100 [Vibrio neptunius]|uniref:hypothetical protein n=1 Tax=Vibrio neptunius TaxID=170651 RepID=UPI001C5CB4FD|nr:hypothetical protein [Vibrio neptunius]QXX07574.1 hypothetical protein KW548_06120 [Vibrio neptunius]